MAPIVNSEWTTSISTYLGKYPGIVDPRRNGHDEDVGQDGERRGGDEEACGLDAGPLGLGVEGLLDGDALQHVGQEDGYHHGRVEDYQGDDGPAQVVDRAADTYLFCVFLISNYSSKVSFENLDFRSNTKILF